MTTSLVGPDRLKGSTGPEGPDGPDGPDGPEQDIGHINISLTHNPVKIKSGPASTWELESASKIPGAADLANVGRAETVYTNKLLTQFLEYMFCSTICCWTSQCYAVKACHQTIATPHQVGST